ncbi:PRC-barrel domain containing protein [Amycolatopsis pithecellobii]|uniref:PRC-barrel domain containing protein n=1 Tax=Amycolatopsis pithecellobii TaxID=664692 RepID=A0A6N7YYD5_9PSEU|nr:PRC-barrel domain containing protein [Amycolatopsis pithecellobii]MTD53369.1 PRC-barrel domain containing protein [Amycolatopsis pithecellobii]
MRASELLGRRVHDVHGRPLGKVTELIGRPDEAGRLVIAAVLVSRRRHARLLAYHRPGREGPWLRHLARILFQEPQEVPWADVRWDR